MDPNPIPACHLTNARVRRIKCDEGKPHCSRCTSTGRQCDGYGSKNRGDAQVKGKQQAKLISSAALPMTFAIKFTFPNPIPNQIINFPDTTSQELRSLEYFRCATANKLSDWLTESFWKYQIPQCGSHEPSLWHAMIAVAAVHEQFTILNAAIPGDPRLDPNALEAQRQFADKHHNMAISELSKLLAARPESSEIALINCALFVILDFVRGNFPTAVLHLHNGMEILGKWRKELDFPFMVEGSLESNILKVFHHLSFQTEPNDYHLDVDECPDYGPDPNGFTGLLGAQISIEHLSQQSLRLIRLGAVISLNPQDFDRISSFDREREEHMARLGSWSQRLGMLLSSLGDDLTSEEEESINELRIMHLSSLMWLGAGLGCASSDVKDGCDTIADLADTLHDWRYRRGLPDNWTRFGWEAGVLPPVYFIATKCQDSRLRKKAVALLLRAAPYLGQDSQLACLDPLNNPYTSGPGILSYPPSISSETVLLREEKTACDKRIHMEVSLQPNTQLVDLVLTPGEDGREWEVRKSVSQPTGSYLGLY